jgi:ribosomal protein S18 acetylase RimI-like enzyme
MELLDNPAWHSLALQPEFAEGDGRARRYRPDVDPLAALPDGAPAETWDALRPMILDGEAVHMLQPSFEVPHGWTIEHRGTVVQMVGVERPANPTGVDFLELGPLDAPEMLALALETRPGPFADRTHELGRFIGIRIDGRLVAMAGERFVLPGMTEVSAVCTDAAHRGNGWAAALTAEVAARIYDRGETPFLHVVEQNHTARRVYERIGFGDRTILEHVYVSPHPR